MPERTHNGRCVIYHAETGERVERFAVDARGMLGSGEYVEVAPGGADEGPAPASAPAAVPAAPEPRIIGLEAEKASRLRERWTKSTEPADYIKKYGEESENGKLARQIVDAENAAKKAERPTVGDAGPAEPLALPRRG